MKRHDKLSPRITRRESFQVCWLPVGALAGGYLIGCSDGSEPAQGTAQQPGTTFGATAGSSTPAAGTTATPRSNPVAGNTAASGNAGRPGSAGPAGAGAPRPSSAGTGGTAAADGTAGAATAGSSSATAGSPSTAAGSPGTATAGQGGSPAASGGSPAAGSAGQVATPSVGWASGGTKSMQGNYPDPFMTAAGAACMVYPSQTLGPCYAQMPEMREDISDGMIGLPTRLSFLVVRNGCTPVPDAVVDIWHCGYNGIYSAFATRTTCNPGTDDVMQERYCRGTRTTDANGRADFNTVFPGWYTGRAVHLHFTVRVGGRASVTSQLYFEDDLVTEIHQQGEYKARGMRSTLNSGDMIFRSGGAKPEQVIMSTAKRADGALHAWKVLSIG